MTARTPGAGGRWQQPDIERAGPVFEKLDALPTTRLLPWEQDLRKAILAAVKEMGNAFPFSQWLERRVGGEVDARMDEFGVEVRLAGGFDCDEEADGAKRSSGSNASGHPAGPAAGVPDKDEFLDSLSPDSFSPEEEALREAVLLYLAERKATKTQATSTVPGLAQFPPVKRARLNFLPRNITLRDWISARIGGEVEFGDEPAGREPVQPLPAAEAVINALVADMAENRKTARPPVAKAGAPPKGAGKGVANKDDAGPPSIISRRKEQDIGSRAHDSQPQTADQEGEMWRFFDSLPGGKLTKEELALREALLDFIDNWDELRPSNRAAGTPPRLADTSADELVRACRQALLPTKIRLADWIDKRIGGEVTTRMTSTGQLELIVRPEVQEEAAQRDDPDARAPGSTSAAAASDFRSTDKTEAKEQWFSTLPQDEFSHDEGTLREEIISALEAWTRSSKMSFNDMANSARAQRAKRSLIPKSCPATLKDWIDRRIGGEVETHVSNSSGNWTMSLRGSGTSDAANRKHGGKRRRLA